MDAEGVVRTVGASGARLHTLLAMEFRRFLNALVRIFCQIIKTGRRLIYRVLGYNQWLPTLFDTVDAIRRLRPA